MLSISLRTFWKEHWVARFILRPLLYAYLALFIFGLCFADAILFPPPRVSYTDDSSILKLTAADGLKISARYLPNTHASYTLLYSHGNGEDLGYDADALQDLHDSGFAVFAYDYHGYGTSVGKPSEANTYLDIDAAYTYLTQTLHVSPTRIIIYGHSLGGGPSVDLAVRKPAAGLILESTFTTPFRAVTRISLLPFDRYYNDRKIVRVRCPVLVMHGTDDHTIPYAHGRQLFTAVRSPKQCLWVPGAGHNNLQEMAGESYQIALKNFVALLDSH